MSEHELFAAKSYQSYLKLRLNENGYRSGQKQKLAKQLGVHSSFLSLILNERSDLSLEQACIVNQFLKHSTVASEYFLLLVGRDRAGTPILRNHYQNQMDQIRSKRLKVSEQIVKKEQISQENRERFYSNYLYCALHVLVSIPSINTIPALARCLHLSEDQISEALNFLIRIGLIKKNGAQFEALAQNIHLEDGNPLINRHHTHWRLHTINNFNNTQIEGIHYSSAVSLAKADVVKIKSALLACLKENLASIAKSKEEVAYVYSFDFYPLVECK